MRDQVADVLLGERVGHAGAIADGGGERALRPLDEGAAEDVRVRTVVEFVTAGNDTVTKGGEGGDEVDSYRVVQVGGPEEQWCGGVVIAVMLGCEFVVGGGVVGRYEAGLEAPCAESGYFERHRKVLRVAVQKLDDAHIHHPNFMNCRRIRTHAQHQATEYVPLIGRALCDIQHILAAAFIRVQSRGTWKKNHCYKYQNFTLHWRDQVIMSLSGPNVT